ncbi:MAG: hypothetical protein EP343_26825 [Deltaproteobacteria bacterium]|nr:MAG: hypothetical protein EP343_26825 [Deltaproteobacteria bacterium]
MRKAFRLALLFFLSFGLWHCGQDTSFTFNRFAPIPYCKADKECPQDFQCYEGTCYSTPPCGNNLVVCNTGCVSLEDNDENCGKCGKKCTKRERCIRGICERFCPSDLFECTMGSCVNLQIDNNNCGSCARRCFGGKLCQNGDCLCPTHQDECNVGCVDLRNDARNCGTCGKECRSTEACIDGRCGCPESTTRCDTRCIDLQTSTLNCGDCYKMCAPRQICRNGRCS